MERNKAAYKLKDFGPLYIINLNAQPERWDFMQEQLDRWQVTNYERISAFDGRNNDLSEILVDGYPNAVTSGEIR
jgi:GR25 family glycosyltransferase involved in LPS biosynthesis